jgi:hypothetical protein
VIKYDAAFNTPWSRQIGTAGSSMARCATGDTAGNIYCSDASTENLFESNKGSQDITVFSIGTDMFTAHDIQKRFACYRKISGTSDSGAKARKEYVRYRIII